MVVFRVLFCGTKSEPDTKKEYVSYAVNVLHDPEDPRPTSVERRYSQFLELYEGLRRESPSLVADLAFPKKALLGNFDKELISERCSGFETFLGRVAGDVRLRESPCTVAFFRNAELRRAVDLAAESDHSSASVVLESVFLLLNKIYTDRSPVVLLALCRLVACGTRPDWAASSQRWVDLALRRFDGVSDADLLSLYAPLLKAGIQIMKITGKDPEPLQTTLNDLKRRGIKIDDRSQLMEAVETYEKNFQKSSR